MHSSDADGVGDAVSPPSLALATWGLFVGLGLLLVGSGLFGTLLGVRAELAGLPTIVSSAIAGAYYTGFLAGSRLTLDALATRSGVSPIRGATNPIRDTARQASTSPDTSGSSPEATQYR